MPDGERLLDLIGRRVSCRAYRSDPVPDEAIAYALECARLAPSACNRQPWRLAVVRDEARRRELVRESLLPGLKMAWAETAPVLIVLGMEREILTHVLGASISGVDYPWIDMGIAGEHLVLAATEMGLGTCWIGWLRPAVVRRIVGWRRSVWPVAMITVGWPDPAAPRRSPAERRRPIDELVTRL